MKHYRIITALTLFTFLMSGCTWWMDVTHKEPIVQDPSKRTLGSTIDDSTIERIVTVNLKKHHESFRQSHFSAISFNGVVLLAGQVRTSDLRDDAATIAHKVLKVRQVHNELAVRPNTSFFARVNDGWLTSKVKTKLAFSSRTPANRMKVITENGHVYLMGLVSQQEANAAVDIARNTGGVQKVVSVFELID